ncbi:MAG: glutamate-5-semialdehyde dehydrogenase [Olsenella profusa]
MATQPIRDVAARMRLESPAMAASPVETRNAALVRIKQALLASQDDVFAANAHDLERARRGAVAPAVIKRLRFGEHKLADVVAGLDSLRGLPDPLGRTLLSRELDEGLTLTRVSCPIGVIGVMFEARPDALVQIASLCIKSGNVAILKGGSETAETNRVIFGLVHAAAVGAGLPASCLFQAEAHSEIDELLACYGLVDLLIPRGSNAFVRHIMDNTKIPVMGHADGICHIYVDAAADVERAVPLCVDAKCQYTAACNAVETLLVHADAAERFLPALAAAYDAAGVEMRGDERTRALIPCAPATSEDWDSEYLAPIISIKVVDSLDEAIAHINRHGSHHTDAILTEDAAAAGRFMDLVDSAGVYQNASTRFADGFRYGFGAEVGISTSKLHARGPVGLDGLVTYKYRLRGHGQVVGDYAEGRRQFHFRDLA